jgi:prepilin-type N-terminal cleavage/methylation domain-containing protein
MSSDRPSADRADDSAAGFTLIEMVIALAMLMIVMLGVYRALKTANTSSTALAEMTQQESDSRRAVDVLVSDLRMVWTGSATLTRFDAAFDGCSVTFYAPTRDTTAKLRRIRYTVSGSDLLRSETVSTNTSAPWAWPGGATPVWSPAIRVLSGIHNVPTTGAGCSAAYPVFTYRTKTDAAITVPGSAASTIDVKRVEVDLTIDRIVGKFPDPDVFSTSVEMRSQ